MLTIYRALLCLYPSAYRDEYGEEMIAVIDELHADILKKGWLARAVSYAREAGGLLCGALREHLRSIFGSYSSSMFLTRRLTMRSEFRFPKATVTLMAIILGGVMMAIHEAKVIEVSFARANSHVGPIQTFTVLPSLLLILVGACVAGAIGWRIVFSMHRSGVHRLVEVDPSSGQGRRTKLSA